MSFGALLRSERVRAGKSLRALAAHLGMSPGHVSIVERGQDLPFSDESIRCAAAFIGTDASALLAAAIETRGFAKLALVGVSDHQRRVGVEFALWWRVLTHKQLDAIKAAIEGPSR